MFEHTVPPSQRMPAVGSPADIAGRMERLPRSRWQTKARLLIGTATFFDAFDALAIAQVLPVLIPLWDLNSGQTGLLISIGYLGQLVGALLFSALAERHGRVIAMVFSVMVFASMSIACVLAWNFDTLLVFRTLQGIGLGGQVPIAAVYISEMTKAHGRGRFVLLYELVFSVGVVAAGLVGFWVVPHLGWQYMFLAGATPLLTVYVLRTWLPESPRWLSSRGRHDDAAAAMARIENKVSQATGTPLPPPSPSAPAVGNDDRSSVRELFRASYRRRTLVVWCVWFSSYLVYYGVSTWLPTLYRTTFGLPLGTSLRYGLISNCVGFAGAAVCAMTIDLFGRRTWFAVALTGSALCLGLLVLSGADTPSDVLVYGSGAYFFAAAAAIGVYLYTPELYPTRIRAIGVGAASAWLRLASMAGPLLIGRLIGHGLAPIFAVFAAVSAAAAVVTVLYGVETKERVLEEVSP